MDGKQKSDVIQIMICIAKVSRCLPCMALDLSRNGCLIVSACALSDKEFLSAPRYMR